MASKERRPDVIFKGVKRFLTPRYPLIHLQDPQAITKACLTDHGTRLPAGQSRGCQNISEIKIFSEMSGREGVDRLRERCLLQNCLRSKCHSGARDTKSGSCASGARILRTILENFKVDKLANLNE